MLNVPSLSVNGMTGPGRVFPSKCTLVRAKVIGVSGGVSPTFALTHGGGAVIQSAAATVGAELDFSGAPIECPSGLFLDVGGNPRSIEVHVWFR